jgi:hypothetical protein
VHQVDGKPVLTMQLVVRPIHGHHHRVATAHHEGDRLLSNRKIDDLDLVRQQVP